MQTQHTPGPWLYARLDDDIEAMVTEDGDSIFDVRGITPADLNLIAAAPALLATLAELVAEWDALHADEDHKTGYTLDTGGIIAARALLESLT